MAANDVDAEKMEGRIEGFVQVLADEGLQQLWIVTIRVDDPMRALAAEA